MDYLKKIISGGQTGTDLGALVCAKRLKIPTGGWAPKGYRTEKGPQPVLASYGLKEHQSADYTPRTEQNVIDADATLVISTNPNSPGTIQTVNFAQKHNRTVSEVINPFDKDAPRRIADFLTKHKPAILNVGGNRESKSPGITSCVATVLMHAITLTNIADVFCLDLNDAIVQEEATREASVIQFPTKQENTPTQTPAQPEPTEEQIGLNFETVCA